MSLHQRTTGSLSDTTAPWNAFSMAITENTFNAHKYQIASAQFHGISCLLFGVIGWRVRQQFPYNSPTKALWSSEIPVQGLPESTRKKHELRNFSCAFGLVETRSVGRSQNFLLGALRRNLKRIKFASSIFPRTAIAAANFHLECKLCKEEKLCCAPQNKFEIK